jgi:hypothetical protein
MWFVHSMMIEETTESTFLNEMAVLQTSDSE